MRRPSFIPFLIILALFPSQELHARQQDALQLAINAMGGRELLGSIRTLEMQIKGHEFILDAFVREDGPKPVEYDDIEQVLDFEGRRSRVVKAVQIASETRGRTMTIVADREAAAISFTLPDGNERSVPGRRVDVRESREMLDLSPFRILLTAEGAPDIRQHSDTRVDGLDMTYLQFTFEDQDVHLYIHADSGLPYRVETRGPRRDDFSWRMWSEVVQSTTFYSWSKEPSGLRVPRQWDITRNDLPWRSRMITQIEINPDLSEANLAINDETRSAFAARAAQPDQTVQEFARPAPGIVALQTWFRVVVAEQEDGIVIIDAPVSPAITQAVIDTVRARYPDKPITAAVIAAGAWTQFGGVAAFAKAHIPVYGPAYHAEIFERFVQSHTGSADWDFRPVDAPLTLEDAVNPVVLLPPGGVNSRGALLTVFPSHRLLYGSGELLPDGMSVTSSIAMDDARRALRTAGLEVDQWFSMFAGVTQW